MGYHNLFKGITKVRFKITNSFEEFILGYMLEASVLRFLIWVYTLCSGLSVRMRKLKLAVKEYGN